MIKSEIFYKTNTGGKYLKLKYLFIFYAIIRFPLHQLTGLIDSAGRIYTSLLIVTFLYYWVKSGEFRSNILKKPLIYRGLWVLYVIANYFVQGSDYNMKFWQILTLLIVPIALMYLVNINKNIDFIKTLVIISLASYTSMIIIILNEKMVDLGVDRLGSILNANELGIDALLTFIFLYLLYWFKKLKFWQFIILAILPLLIVILSGSRTAFLPLVLLGPSLFVINRSRNILKTISMTSFGVVILIVSYNLIQDNSVVIDRIVESRDEVLNEYKTDTNLDYFGSRTAYYVFGYTIFIDNPVFGVGLFNYRKHNPINHQPNHVEIMIQLSEFGLVGFLLFIVFNIWMGKQLYYCWRKHKKYRKTTEAFIAGFLSVVSIYFASYTYWNILISLYLGTTIGYIMLLKSNNRKVLNFLLK